MVGTGRSPRAPRQSRTWLSIRVELVEGLGQTFWPRPGRILAAAPIHTFAQLASAIDEAFARWDRSHLHEFRFADGTRIGMPEGEWEKDVVADDGRTSLARLKVGERFLYTFDFGDGWAHLCTVTGDRIDPLETLGIATYRPLPYWGWGTIPDQYGRRWDGDDGESDSPPNPGFGDLPPLQPGWGPPGG